MRLFLVVFKQCVPQYISQSLNLFILLETFFGKRLQNVFLNWYLFAVLRALIHWLISNVAKKSWRSARQEQRRSQARDLARQSDAAVIAILPKSTRTPLASVFRIKKRAGEARPCMDSFQIRAKKSEQFWAMSLNLLPIYEALTTIYVDFKSRDSTKHAWTCKCSEIDYRTLFPLICLIFNFWDAQNFTESQCFMQN